MQNNLPKTNKMSSNSNELVSLKHNWIVSIFNKVKIQMASHLASLK